MPRVTANRYDGNSFVVYKHSNGDSLSLSSNHVTALAEDDRGNLWVGTMNGLNRMDLRVDRVYSLNDMAAYKQSPFIIRGFQACMWIDKSVFGLEQIKVYTCMIMRMIRLS
ncbi:MAG: two-component regulator propeller domain-containing protein [Parabacteroides merdae]